MKITVTADDMKRKFEAYNRDYFTYDGLNALLDYYNEIDELEIERKQLVNEELTERIELEHNLNTIAGFIKISMYARIGILIILILIFVFGIIKVRL